MREIIGLLIVLILHGSCNIVRETHHVRFDENYYRINIKATSLHAKSRYVSGYFDENALDQYFGEMSQPKDTSHPAFLKVSTDGVSSVGPEKLVMILSANSDVIAQEIQNIAENEELLKTIALLANQEKVQEHDLVMLNKQTSFDRNSSVIALGDQFIGGLADDADTTTIKNNISNFLTFLQQKVEGSNVDRIEELMKTYNR